MAAQPEIAIESLQAPWQPRLELFTLRGRDAARPPILLVHGAYTHAGSWLRTFAPWFRARGHDVHAVSLRGHGGSDGRATLDAWGLDHYRGDVERALAAIGRPAIVVGQSMGGLVLQRLIAAGGRPLGVVLLSSVPPSGLIASVSRMALRRPHSLGSLVQVALGTRDGRGLLELLAHDPLPGAHEGAGSGPPLLGRESSRALWEMTWAPMPLHLPVAPPPVLAIHGEQDLMIPAGALDEIGARWNATCVRVSGIGHVPMIERRWRTVAGPVARWIDALR
ncbi:MAG TPA: alpha/beta fold hydrolase [Burkholderiaceae bacterium]|nr:alpha/beta fold hydrolase [Burkholderiaceae bacterium]